MQTGHPSPAFVDVAAANNKEEGSEKSIKRAYPVVTTEVQKTVRENLQSLYSTPLVSTPLISAPVWRPMVLGWHQSQVPLLSTNITTMANHVTIIPMAQITTPAIFTTAPNEQMHLSVTTVNDRTNQDAFSVNDQVGRGLDSGRKRRGNSSPFEKDLHGKKKKQEIIDLEPPRDHYSQLSEEIYLFAQHNQQSNELLQRKLRLRSALLTIFRRQFPAASLHLVGSSCNGFANESSDADFCLMVTHARRVDQRNEAHFYLNALKKLLQGFRTMRQVLLIRAKVPILKFKDTVSGCECDVNVNNATGIRNTHLLRTYSRVDDRVRPMVMAVKRWAKSRQINDASQGTLSSYSLVLMVIHYLQSAVHPPVIDSLQEKFPDFFKPEINVDVLPMFDAANSIVCNISENKLSLGELLVGFFKYFAVDYRWDYLVISIRRGRATPRQINADWDNKFICIEEPFDSTNTARAVHEYNKFQRVKTEFERAHEKIQKSKSLQAIL